MRRTDAHLIAQVAIADWIVVLGLCTSSLAAGFAAIIGTSRVLYAVAKDRLLPLGVFAVSMCIAC